MTIDSRVRITDGSIYDGFVGTVAAVDDDCVFVEVGQVYWWPVESGEYAVTDALVTVKRNRKKVA